MKRDAKGMLPTQWYEYWLQADTTFSSTPMYRRHQEQIIEALEVYRKQLAKQKHLFDEMGTMDFSPVIEDKR